MNYGTKINKRWRAASGTITFEDGKELKLSRPQTEEFNEWLRMRLQPDEPGTIDVNSRVTLSEGLRKMVMAYTLPLVLARLLQVTEDSLAEAQVQTDEPENCMYLLEVVKSLKPIVPRIEKAHKTYQDTLKTNRPVGQQNVL